MNWMELVTADNIMKITIVSAVVTFFLILIISKYKNIKIQLEGLIVRTLAVSAFPSAFFILCFAYDPILFSNLTNFLQLQIALSGLVLIYVSASTLFAPFNKND